MTFQPKEFCDSMPYTRIVTQIQFKNVMGNCLNCIVSKEKDKEAGEPTPRQKQTTSRSPKPKQQQPPLLR